MIADRIAIFVNQSYGSIAEAEGITLLMAVVFFAFQLYLDFSAYSDIAIGTARIFGFKLTTNFRRPYLATSFSDFWKRWHITLSSWFQDYIYIPLGGNRRGEKRTIVNVMIVFLLSGLWHGASWNFVIWGALNGLFLVVFDRVFRFEKSNGFKRIIVSIFVTVSWALSLVFFRAQSFGDAMLVFHNIGFSNTDVLYNFGLNSLEFKFSIMLISGTILYEILAETVGEKLLDKFYATSAAVRWSLYFVLVISIIYLGSYGSANDNAFIYFQF